MYQKSGRLPSKKIRTLPWCLNTAVNVTNLKNRYREEPWKYRHGRAGLRDYELLCKILNAWTGLATLPVGVQSAERYDDDTNTVISSEFAPRGDVYFLRKTITPGVTQGNTKKKSYARHVASCAFYIMMYGHTLDYGVVIEQSLYSLPRKNGFGFKC